MTTAASVLALVWLVSASVSIAAAAGQAGPQAPVRVGGDIKEPRKIKHVPPVYPEEAREAKVQGIVIIEAIINREGLVRDARVLRGVDLLNQAAVNAVMQWEFTPTRLNDQPVEVVMTVTVSFMLSGE
jgi:protein TonB